VTRSIGAGWGVDWMVFSAVKKGRGKGSRRRTHENVFKGDDMINDISENLVFELNDFM